MAVLSVILLLVILGESLADEGSGLETAFFVAGWLLWAVFAAEFVVRVVISPDAGLFLKRNWWQVGFLLLPFLRILRLVAAVRVLRAGRVLSGAVRSSRSSRRALGDRIMWLAALSIIVILAGSQLLFEFGDFDSYGDALRATAIAATVGEPLGQDDPWAALIEWALLVYSVVIFATMAGTVGAYLLERGRRSGAATLGP